MILGLTGFFVDFKLNIQGALYSSTGLFAFI